MDVAPYKWDGMDWMVSRWGKVQITFKVLYTSLHRNTVLIKTVNLFAIETKYYVHVIIWQKEGVKDSRLSASTPTEHKGAQICFQFSIFLFWIWGQISNFIFAHFYFCILRRSQRMSAKDSKSIKQVTRKVGFLLVTGHCEQIYKKSCSVCVGTCCALFVCCAMHCALCTVCVGTCCAPLHLAPPRTIPHPPEH